MALTSTPREEESAARKREKQLAKARRAAEEARDREARGKLAGIIRKELAKPRARSCRCGIRPSTTHEQLRALEEGCTGRHRGGRGYICPVLDAIRRQGG